MDRAGAVSEGLELVRTARVLSVARRTDEPAVDAFGRVQDVEVWREPGGRLRVVVATKDSGGVPRVLSVERDDPPSGGRWTASHTDAGIRYVSTTAAPSTVRRWIAAAKQLDGIAAAEGWS